MNISWTYSEHTQTVFRNMPSAKVESKLHHRSPLSYIHWYVYLLSIFGGCPLTPVDKPQCFKWKHSYWAWIRLILAFLAMVGAFFIILIHFGTFNPLEITRLISLVFKREKLAVTDFLTYQILYYINVGIVSYNIYKVS